MTDTLLSLPISEADGRVDGQEISEISAMDALSLAIQSHRPILASRVTRQLDSQTARRKKTESQADQTARHRQSEKNEKG